MAEAEPLYRRALAIDEASYGSDHPKVATNLNNLSMLLQSANRLAEAEPLGRQMLEILLRSSLRSGHEQPYFQGVVNNYLRLLSAMGQDEAGQQGTLDAIMESVITQVGHLGEPAPRLLLDIAKTRN